MRIFILCRGIGSLTVLRCLVLPSGNVELILGKGQREELDEEEGGEIARKMRLVVEGELKKQREKDTKSSL